MPVPHQYSCEATSGDRVCLGNSKLEFFKLKDDNFYATSNDLLLLINVSFFNFACCGPTLAFGTADEMIYHLVSVHDP